MLDYKAVYDTLQGGSLEAYHTFGAHCTHEYGKDGVRFTVFAPGAKRVDIIGSFNEWEGYAMQRLECGVYSLFVDCAREKDMYKFRIHTAGGEVYDRIDPFAFYSEVRPDTASIVCRLDGFPWSDGEWMQARSLNYQRPMNLYELHAGSWKRPEKDAGGDEKPEFYNYKELADVLIPYVKEQGFTHIELLPLTEHPFDGSWGYQVTGYYSVTSRYGEPKDFMGLVDRCHAAGIGVIIDFVPVHFVKDFYALHQYDGSFVSESGMPQSRESPWGTALFDFTKPYVQSFLKSSLDFFMTYYHVDGVRYDAVSNLLYLPDGSLNEPGIWFLKSANFALAQRHPGVMRIAEDSSMHRKVTAPVVYGGLGFDYKWDLGWMHDTLEYFALPPQSRGQSRGLLLQSMQYFYQDIFILPFSHDEVVHGKKTIIDKLWGSYEQKFCQLRCLYLYMFAHPGKKLNFMGNELAEFKEWDEKTELGWNLLTYPAHDAFHHFWRDLCAVYRQEPALYAEDYNMQGFSWVDAGERIPAVFAFERSDLKGRTAYAAMNLSESPCYGYHLRVRQPGAYEELIHTDAQAYGGCGAVCGALHTQRRAGMLSVPVNLPPFSACLLRPVPKNGAGE